MTFLEAKLSLQKVDELSEEIESLEYRNKRAKEIIRERLFQKTFDSILGGFDARDR